MILYLTGISKSCRWHIWQEHIITMLETQKLPTVELFQKSQGHCYWVI